MKEMSNFKISYVVSSKAFERLIKRKKENEENVRVKKREKKEKNKVLVKKKKIKTRNLTEFSKLVKRMPKKKDVSQSKQTLITDYFSPVKETLLNRFPLSLKSKVSDVLSYMKKNISTNVLSWDKNSNEIQIYGKQIANSSIVDILKYLFGYGEMWDTNYSANEFGKKIGKIRLIPRGADDFFFILYENKKNISSVLDFDFAKVINLVRFNFLVKRGLTDKEEIVNELVEIESQLEKEKQKEEQLSRKERTNLFTKLVPVQAEKVPEKIKLSFHTPSPEKRKRRGEEEEEEDEDDENEVTLKDFETQRKRKMNEMSEDEDASSFGSAVSQIDEDEKEKDDEIEYFEEVDTLNEDNEEEMKETFFDRLKEEYKEELGKGKRKKKKVFIFSPQGEETLRDYYNKKKKGK